MGSVLAELQQNANLSALPLPSLLQISFNQNTDASRNQAEVSVVGCIVRHRPIGKKASPA